MSYKCIFVYLNTEMVESCQFELKCCKQVQSKVSVSASKSDSTGLWAAHATNNPLRQDSELLLFETKFIRYNPYQCFWITAILDNIPHMRSIYGFL